MARKTKKESTELSGDVEATPEKAFSLLKQAREELDRISSDTAQQDRACLRQVAAKGWMAVAGAADAYLLRREHKTAKSTADVKRVYSSMGAQIKSKFTNVYSTLHTTCAYEDDVVCDRKEVRKKLHEAGELVDRVSRALVVSNKKRR